MLARSALRSSSEGAAHDRCRCGNTPVLGIEAQSEERPVVNRMVVGSSPTDPARSLFWLFVVVCPVRVVQRPSTPVSLTGNAGSIPATDARCSLLIQSRVGVVQRLVPPSFQRQNAGSIPVTDPETFLSCRCRTIGSTSVSRTENAGSIPVTDPETSCSCRCRIAVQYSRFSNGQHGFDSRHRCSSFWQSVLGTTMAHSRPCDGSIPSTATFARPAVEALHAYKLVQLQSSPLVGSEPSVRHSPSKRRTLCGFDTRARNNF